MLLDGTYLKIHFSDIVNASATKSGSDVKLIDPFQLINWKDKTPPDHLYPKFKPFLEEFKKGMSAEVPRITYENSGNHETQEVSQQEIANCETIEQRFQAAKEKESPAGIDLVLKKLMDTTMTPDPLDVPDSLVNSKRPINKNRVKETKGPSKPQYHIPIQIPKDSKQSKKKRKQNRNQKLRYRKKKQSSSTTSRNSSPRNLNSTENK